MKKLFILVLLIVFFTGLVNAQETSQVYESKYYKVYSEISQTHAQQTAEKIDAYFELFNTYFHFDPSELSVKLKVKILSSEDSYKNYLARTVPDVKNSFVYLQYRNEEKSELVGFYEDDDSFDSAMIHHGFIQFLKSFVKNPPLWLQKGFAIFFEKCVYLADQKKVSYKENLAWLETIKDYVEKSDFAGGSTSLYPLEDLLTLSTAEAESGVDVFYAESWGLVHFLVNSEYKSYNRALWDAVGALQADATKSENESAIDAKAFSWINPNLFQADFLAYVSEVKSFPELVQYGMDEYAAGDLEDAEEAFDKALKIDDTHYIPLYYLGLINYDNGDYAMAEYYYHSALQLGSNVGLAYYALGVNSFADNRYEDAVFYLEQSVDVDPSGYGSKSQILINRIQEELEAEKTFGEM